MEEEKNVQLWQQAKARVDFKTHLTVYIIINSLLWLIWLFTAGVHTYPWPVWPTIGWGTGVIFNYLGVYKAGNSVEKEYEKLKSGQSQ
ncbi:MAG: 2TM domain-containing protein [Ferruginibacter sp.]